MPTFGSEFRPGVDVAAGTNCPGSFPTSIDLNAGLSSDTGCTGCSCTASMTCALMLYTYGTGTAATAACEADTAMTGGTSLNGTGFGGFGCTDESLPVGETLRSGPFIPFPKPCVASGTPATPPATWADSTRFCAAAVAHAGGGCAAGQVCVPKATTMQHCIIADGAQTCPTSYTAMGSAWYTGLDDTRTCDDCECGAQTPGNCTKNASDGTPYTFNFFAAKNVCTGTPAAALTSASQLCSGLTEAAQSVGFSIISTPVQPSCPATSAIIGSLTPTGEQTICCL